MSNKVYGTGRRKTSVARVTLTEGNGKFIFNGKDFDQYFPSPSMKMTVNKPFKVVSLENKFDIHVNVTGSGLSSQADAVSLGISRALIKLDPELRPKLKKAGLLTRDSRKVERKKYGLKKARRAEQFTKR
jgi:small subunit ribosomal protein S9